MNGPVYGVLGHPVRHSRSPAMHAAWLRAEGLPGTYVAFEVPVDASGEQIVSAVRTLGLAGVNLTIPFKERVIPFLDAVEPAARRAGAVNTIAVREGRLHGSNTDIPGFAQALAQLRAGAAPAGVPVVLGAGGAARAVVVALAEAGFPPGWVLNRSVDRARALVAELGVGWRTGPLDGLARIAPTGTVFVHALSRRAPVPEVDGVPAGAVWMDLNYDSPSNAVLPVLAARGIAVQDGREMLLRQGALAFAAFTGRDTDLEAARAVLYGGEPS